MTSTVTSTNNLSLRSILEKDKLTGSNFLDWERNLMIVLRHERKWYVLEEPLGEAPPANAPAAARNAHKKHSDDLLDVACLMLATMSPDLQAGLINTNAYDMIRQLRDMFQTQARTERYDATKAFNECKMVKGTVRANIILESEITTRVRARVSNQTLGQSKFRRSAASQRSQLAVSAGQMSITMDSKFTKLQSAAADAYVNGLLKPDFCETVYQRVTRFTDIIWKLKIENISLTDQVVALEKSTSSQQAELLIKVTDLEDSLSNERSLITSLKKDLQNVHDQMLNHSFGNAQNLKLVTSLRKENECLQKKVLEFNEDNKGFENKLISSQSRVMELSKQVTDFEQMLIIERSNFEKERKVFDLTSVNLSKKISELERKIILDKKNSLKKPSLRAGKYQNMMHEFEEEIQGVHSVRKVDDKKCIELQKQIVDLQNQLSDVRHQFKQKEKVLRHEKSVLEQIIAEPKKPSLVEADFEDQKEVFKAEIRKLTSKLSELSTNIMNEQRMRSDQQKKLDDLLEERTKFSSKLKELEKTTFKAHNSSNVGSASLSNINSSGQIRTSNLFYDRRVDYSGNHRFSNSKFIWQVKGSSTKDIEVSMINPEPEDLPKKHIPRLDLVCEGVNEDSPNHHEGEKFYQRHLQKHDDDMGYMGKRTSVSDHVMKMKRHLDHLERLGHPVPLQLATDTILNSLSEDYRPFVVNYNMNNMEKTIAELHSMLKTAELNMGNKNKTKDVLMVKDGGVKKKNGQASTSKGKGPVQAIQSAPKKGKGKGKGKKVKPNKARTENRCFICNEIGHWRQNCPKRHEAGRNHSSTQQLRKVAVSHIQELEVSPGSYDQLLNNSYKCCRLKVAHIFDRVANIGRDPRLRLLLGKRVAIKGVTRFSGSRGVKGRVRVRGLLEVQERKERPVSLDKNPRSITLVSLCFLSREKAGERRGRENRRSRRRRRKVKPPRYSLRRILGCRRRRLWLVAVGCRTRTDPPGSIGGRAAVAIHAAAAIHR
ncbi:hypothetical protein OSB04_011714 [Centaurea solstitialis]|uniref:CCHC-type domain-containing protein n=1 Tax=Centaurea solstitialis TaxID=347529 RepID=A0AA38T9Z2_9ASTR|nr:hypothetical protein OSB04_011714 [Centaurea solstitialis]